MRDFVTTYSIWSGVLIPIKWYRLIDSSRQSCHHIPTHLDTSRHVSPHRTPNYTILIRPFKTIQTAVLTNWKRKNVCNKRRGKSINHQLSASYFLPVLWLCFVLSRRKASVHSLISKCCLKGRQFNIKFNLVALLFNSFELYIVLHVSVFKTRRDQIHCHLSFPEESYC